jgi:uncharacterized phage-associated protein
MAVQFQLDFERTLESITYISSKEIPELTTYKLCKLLFLADKYHLVRFGRPITGDRYCALPDGPVPSTVYDWMKEVLSTPTSAEAREIFSALAIDKSYQYPRLRAARNFNSNSLSRSDMSALDHVIKQFGKFNFPQLRAITHEMIAYANAWDRREGRNSEPMNFEDFFEEEADALAGVREDVIENALLRKILAEESSPI